MKKFLVLILALGCLICSAQNNTPAPPTGTQTSPNLVYTTMNPWQGPAGTTAPYTWSGFSTTTSTGGGTSGGSLPGYNSTTGIFMFGYTQNTINYTYALSTALKNSGMTWLGYNYSWDYINQGMTKGNLSATVTFDGTNGSALHTKNWTLGATTDGWTNVKGTETFTTPLGTASINSFSLKFSGKDDRFWAGYYGPQVKNPSISVLYSFDACSSNPLSSPDCPGYAAAYKTQQCTANPLYAADCPGYDAAYKTQQCSANPLYATDCPGYAEAYKTQQCTLDPLYDTTCTGYAAAYKTQQCTANALYATDCPGYAQAYLNQQCLKDSLYSKQCEGYATAYAIKYLVNLDPAVTTAVNQQLTTTNEIAKNDPAKVTVVNSTVDSVLSTPSTTNATSTSPASVTSVIVSPPSPGTSPVANATNAAAAPPPPLPPAKQEERAQEQKKTDNEVAKVERKSGGNQENARKEVAQKAKELAQNAGKANTMEGQVATQGLLVGLIGYVPGFAGYQQAILPDSNGLELALKYSKPVVDNRNAQRRLQGASDRLHNEMVDSQYRINR